MTGAEPREERPVVCAPAVPAEPGLVGVPAVVNVTRDLDPAAPLSAPPTVLAVTKAVAELDAEHYPDLELKGRGGCVMCWPKDGSWPCTTRLIADELRAHNDAGGGSDG
jgi:hypothetical protein